ncbi:MAG: TonB-dependent receptor, partial [Bacteroidales bacterium]|nr:TonB-dependent receptor [Bacteroidales bacterium]
MKNIYQKLVISLFFLLLGVAVYAQGLAVEGTVTDGETGEGLPGVNVLEKGTTNGVITDLDGNYSITVENNQSQITFSFVGYKIEEVEVGGRSVIDISLKLDMVALDRIVLIGYGVQKKKVVTGAIESIDSDEINSTPVLRVEQALQGRLAGVQMTSQSGQPGEAPTVRIRGIGTTENADPIYIVDGIAVGGIDYLNPGDIESIDVLKDAASAAIYGSRAANGVVLITTKSGSKGKMNITYSGYQGYQNATKKLDLLNAHQYRELMNEGARNSGQTEPFDLNEIPAHSTNWVDELFQTNVPIFNHELSVTGGSEKSSFASSFSYFSQQGVIGGEQSQFDRITARLNSKHQVLDNLHFGNNLAYSNIVRRGIESNQSFNGPYSSALNLDPLTPVFEKDTDILDTYPYNSEPVVTDESGKVYGISNYVGAEVVNPLALLETDTDETRVDKVVGNVFAELEIIKDLKLKSSLGIDMAYETIDSYKPLYFLNGAQLNVDKTSVNKEIKRYYTWQLENTLHYTKKIKNHTISALVGMTASEYNYENLTGFNAKVPVTDPDNVFLDMATDTVWKAGGGASHSSLYSNFGRITYDYKEKYAFTGIIRRDGSSRFGENKRFGIFPSVGVSWVISDEGFFPQLDMIKFIKLRASYGINGNENIGDYRFISVMDNSRDYIFSGGRSIGASPEYVENADIQWEESEQLDLALDFGLLDNRLTGTFDYYIKNTNGLLETIPIPAHVGNAPPVANVGSVQNRGVELSVDWRHVVNDITYRIGINGAYNKNTVTHVGNSEKVILGATYAVAGAVTRSEEGYPIAYFWGYKTDGIFQSESDVFQHIGKTGEVLQPNAVPGDLRFVDYNDDGVLDDEDKTFIGNPTPALTYGFNASVEYKGFDFAVLFVGSYGNDVFNGTQRQDLQYTNRTTAILDRWTGPGTSNEIPRYTWIDVNNNYRISDLYIESGSYMRLKNIQLGYNLPKNLLDKIRAENWRFYVSAENLLTFTKY